MNATLLPKQHRCFKSLFLAVTISLVFHKASAQTTRQYFTAEKSYAVKLGTTRPLYDIAGVLPTDADKLKDRKSNKPRIVPNFGGRRQLIEHNPNALPQGPDPLFSPASSRMPTHDILPIVNIEGIGEGSSGSTPPDVNGDIGRDFYVEIVNATFFRVYDKAGRLIFYKKGYTNTWDATINGNYLAEGTYYYYVDFGFGLKKLKGFITIVKD